MIKAVLFDFNGTLIDDDDVNEASWRRYIEGMLARPITEEEVQEKIHGRNAQDSLRYFLGADLTAAECSEMEEGKEVIYRRMTEERKLTLMPGAEDFLNTLKKRQVRLNIGTAAGLGNIKFFFPYYRLDRWFDPELVVYNDGKIKGKPAPDIYLKAAERIGVSIGESAVFEDSESGLEAGRRAGAGAVIRMNPTENAGMKAGRITGEFKDYRDAAQMLKLLGMTYD